MGKAGVAEPDSNMGWNQTPVDGLLPLWKTQVIPWSLLPFWRVVRGLPRFPTPPGSVNLPQAFQHAPHEPGRAHASSLCNPPQAGAYGGRTLLINEGTSGAGSGCGWYSAYTANYRPSGPACRCWSNFLDCRPWMLSPPMFRRSHVVWKTPSRRSTRI